VSLAEREKIIGILRQEVYRGFGPTLASEYLVQRHKVEIGREALRQIMISSGLWKARGQKVERVHQWRARRSCRGELVQWDTSEGRIREARRTYEEAARMAELRNLPEVATGYLARETWMEFPYGN